MKTEPVQVGLLCSNRRGNRRARWTLGLAAAFTGLAHILNAQTVILSEGFEGHFPQDNGWSVEDNNSAGTPAYWDDVGAAFGGQGTHGGAWKGYCAGFGYAGTSASPQYRDYMTAYMSRTINLIGYTSATLTFWYNIPSIETGRDYARVYVDSIDPVLAWSASNAVTNWTPVTIDLSAYVGTSPGLRFEFFSNGSNTAEGWYLDDILVTGVPSATCYHFDQGLPPGPQVFGSGYVDSTGGVGNSGVLKLTDNTNDQSGAFLSPVLLDGAALGSFEASFSVLVGFGSGIPADGFSFCFANDLPAGVYPSGEEGAGSGLRVCFDNYDNGGGEAPAIDVKWGTTTVAHAPIPKLQHNTYSNVVIRLDPDGTVDLTYGGAPIYYNVPTPFVPIANARFGFAARTGGAYEAHWIDNVCVTAYPLPLPDNDQCAGAIALATGVTFRMDTSSATSINDPGPDCRTNFGKGVWFRYTAPASGPLAISTLGSTFDTVLKVFRGGCGALVEVPNGCNDDFGGVGSSYQASLIFEGVADMVYWILVGGYRAQGGTLHITAGLPLQFCDNFNSGLPSGTRVFGNAFVDSSDGVLKLTTATGGQLGSFLFPSPSGAAPVESVIIAFKASSGGGANTPADGWSVNFAGDLPDGPFGEEGAGTGLTIAFDTYDNGDGEAPAIDILSSRWD